MGISRRGLTRIGIAVGAVILILIVTLVLVGKDKSSSATTNKNSEATPSPTAAPLILPSNSTTPSTVYTTSGCRANMTPLASGVFNVTVNGSVRHYIVRVPLNYDPKHAYRLLLAFHWKGGTMDDVATKFFYYGMQLYHNESMVLIAPQGLDNAWPNNGGEDIEFVRQILSMVESRLCVDPQQRYAMGFSYGASMTHSVACTLGDQFRAVSVLSGGEYSGCDGNGTTPVAYMIMHGLRDTVIPIAKGRALRDTFVKANKCTPQTPPEPKEGDLNHISTAYEGCASGHPVEWTVFDDGHTAQPLDGTLMQNSTATWMPLTVWTFFSKFE